jgi:hypothetical protein
MNLQDVQELCGESRCIGKSLAVWPAYCGESDNADHKVLDRDFLAL